MTAHLLLVGAPKADRPHTLIDQGKNEAIAPSVHSGESPVANLAVVSPIIHLNHRRLKIEVCGFRQRKPVLGEIGAIFRGIKFEIYK